MSNNERTLSSVHPSNNTDSQKIRKFSLLMGVGLSVALTIYLASNYTPSQVDNASFEQQTISSIAAPLSYILKTSNPQQAQKLSAALQQMNVIPTHNLAIINAIAAPLTPSQVAQLQQRFDLQISENYQVELAGRAVGQRRWQPEATVPSFINATAAHQQSNYGEGVTIGFVDTGLDNLAGLGTDLYGHDKYWGTFDAVNNQAYNTDNEANGHGTHVSSIASNSDYDVYGKIYGVAPNARLVGIKAFDAEGKASYADVIRGIDWAVSVKDDINLRVLNMSFSGPIRSYYWEDPLNQAVMKAWQAGIVVVTSAGNIGPNPMTIGVPGNNPYVITVGAMTDNYTPTDLTDDKIASFSSSGPTVEGHVKPDLMAPGGHMSGLMDLDTYIVAEHPEFHDGGRYFEMSGTSQAAGVISGVAALILTAEPNLSPDDVKCRLISGAHAAVKSDGSLAYSAFQQGAGLVNAYDSLISTATGCANKGLDIAMDLAGQQHYYGPAAINANGDFYIEGESDRYIWDIPADLTGSDGTAWQNLIKAETGFNWQSVFDTDGGSIWKNSFDASINYSWRENYEAQATAITNATLMTNGGSIWKNGITDISTQSIGVNNWVNQQ